MTGSTSRLLWLATPVIVTWNRAGMAAWLWHGARESEPALPQMPRLSTKLDEACDAEAMEPASRKAKSGKTKQGRLLATKTAVKRSDKARPKCRLKAR